MQGSWSLATGVCLAASLGCTLGAAPIDWTTWPTCNSRRLSEAPEELEKKTLKANGENGITVRPDMEIYRKLYQIVYINATDGKLYINKDATAVWDTIADDKEEIRVIVNFGTTRCGKSTLASMLGCSMNRASALLFPSWTSTGYSASELNYTEGIWATPPFTHTNTDLGGWPRTSKYMIFDVQSLDRIWPFQGKLSYKRTNNELYKMIAALSEVASIFLYSKDGELEATDLEFIGAALKTTRENLIVRSAHEEGASAPINDVNLRSTNEPALIVIPRDAALDVVADSGWEVDQTQFDTDSVAIFSTVNTTDPAYGQLLLNNYQNVEVDGKQIPLFTSPVPDVAERVPFQWRNEQPYKRETGAACQLWDKMDQEAQKCKKLSQSGVDLPNSPPVYKLAVNNLALKIHQYAPVRMVGSKDADPAPMTGSRLRTFMQLGIDEMNKLGPLPDTEMWRRLMQDRCKAELVQHLDLTYGLGKGTLENGTESTGKLAVLQEGLQSIKEGVQIQLSMWTEWSALWNDGNGLQAEIDYWFESKVLMLSVKPQCSAVGVDHKDLLDQIYKTQSEDFFGLWEKDQRIKKEGEIADLQAKIKDMENKAWWDKNMKWIALGGVIGVLALGFLVNLFAKFSAYCRCCLICCGNTGDTTTTTTVVKKRVNNQIVEDVRSHTVAEGPNIPFANRA